MIRVALVGNPNVGKSVIFNALTGAKQKIGNWPGVTVEKKEGLFCYKGIEIRVIDLPGIYSLTANSMDEKIARNYILDEKPEVVVNIVDASNIERNLYLTMQLMEIEANVVIALNKMDLAASKGYKIDVWKLSEKIGLPVIPMVATKNEGIKELKQAIIHAAKNPKKPTIKYNKKIENLICEVQKKVIEAKILPNYPSRFIAIKLLEGDNTITCKAKKIRLEDNSTDFASQLAMARYEQISKILGKCMEKIRKPESFSDMVDKVVLDKYLGIPIFLTFMWAMFQFAFTLSAPLSDAINLAFLACSHWAKNTITDPQLASLVGDGIFGGVGFILTFLPPISFVFVALAILEDTGYLSRAAFVMDRVMTKMGLQGKSFIPMLLGFGCNVPAIMATRTIENEVDRKITIMVNPLMSCSARLPVYILFAGTFFGKYAGAVIASMYLMGIILAALIATLFRKFIFGGKPSPLLLEMPPYSIPSLKSVFSSAWVRTQIFLKKAATILFIGAVVVWFLSTHPWQATNGGSVVENSYAAIIGHAIEPLIRPLGLDWTAGIALFAGFMAKEIVVETLGIVYGVGEENVASVIASHFTPASALVMMTITLIYLPCLATVGVLKQELGSWKWTGFVIAYELVLAYIVAGIVFFGCKFMGVS